MSIFAALFNNSPAMCWVPPGPTAEKFSIPGFARASARNSANVFAGTDGCTTITFDEVTSCVTGAKSLLLSYGRLDRMLALMVKLPPMTRTV
jgi:hypothetical protein